MTIAPLNRPEAPLRRIVRRYTGRFLCSRLGESVASQIFALLKVLGFIRFSSPLEYLAPGQRKKVDLGDILSHSPPTAQQTSTSGRAEHPILRTLRLRAGVELLAWLGVYWIPNRLLDLLHREADPGLAIQQFAQNLGCNPEALRFRNPEELNRFRVLTALLSQVESLPESLPASQLRHLDYLLYRNALKRVDEVQWAIVTLTEACGIYRALLIEPIQRLKPEARQLELRRIRAHLLSRADVESSIKFANERDHLVQVFRLCRGALDTIQHRIIDSALLAKQPEADASEMNAKVAHVEEMLRVLKDNKKADLARIIGELDAHTQKLEGRTAALVGKRSPLDQDIPPAIGNDLSP